MSGHQGLKGKKEMKQNKAFGDLNLIEMLCHHPILAPKTLKNAPKWLNSNNSARKSWTKFFHSDLKDLLPVITNA